MNKYLAYLHYIGFTQRNLANIFNDNVDYKNFLENFTFDDLKKFGIKEEKALKILEQREKVEIDKVFKYIIDAKIELISIKDDNYPESLKNLSSPPFLLYIRGNLRNDINLISIVGSRKNTKYSEAVLNKIISALVENNFGIVSGGAYGVDSLAHSLALKNNGYTISVIGTGIDKNYPATNKKLYEDIINSAGAIVSIFPFKTEGEPYNFPIRNEIIAGISNGTLITEAGEKSGTLITAKLALELNKDVFVIPGDITRDTSAGSNYLIQNGLGKLVINENDILEEYIDIYKKPTKTEDIKFSDETEEKIYNFLKKEPKDASFIANKLDIDISIVSYKLSLMEINGIITSEIGGDYRVS